MGKMAVASSSASNPSCSPSKDVKVIKRTKSPGVRVVGGRIYDSENGKTCHQCRQKTRDFMADCKSQKRDKQCTIKFCHKCLLNRYGEKAEDVALLVDWKCPKCRDICNCSCCM
ncbi:cell division cycle-associated protein 7-like [Pistacia vera]|nr:cell division cycle-associated protein 7-like [Pistacia vera]